MQVYRLFDFEFLLVELEYYSTEDWNNNAVKKEAINEKHLENIEKSISGMLFNALRFLYLEREPQFEQNMPVEGVKENDDKEMTEARQLLALHYLLKTGFNIEKGSSSDASTLARFAHLMLGKEYHSLQTSSIYKRLRKMPDHESPQQLIKDLNYIQPYFKELGLLKAVELIEKDLNASKEALPAVQRKKYM